ncbi:MAG: molybdate ABC transporter substrate-binding protein, partial [Actinomycetota bacterium]
AGSASLRAQILEGAPADVIATANRAVMDDLTEGGLVTGAPAILARNRLVVALAPGNPAGIEGLDDLADPEPFVGLCASEVPCGDLADRTAAAAGIRIQADTREPDVRTLLTKIEAGELDAGLVYHTDVEASADGVTAIEVPADLAAVTDYPIALLADATDRVATEAFLAFLAGSDGRTILADHGFELP